MNWHVVSISSPHEIEIARRISEAGFISHCPTWIKKQKRASRGAIVFQTKIEPLYPRYLFVAQNNDFRPELFESSKTRLTVFRKGLLTDEAMSVINSVALDLTMAQSKMTHSLAIKRGDMMQILHGALAGEPVEVLQVRKERILIRFRRSGLEAFRSIEIGVESLGKAN